jgi:hypothetical protein
LRAGGGGRANMRGEEMMVGGEMQALEEAVWDGRDEAVEGVEAQLSAGDGLYIPLGWWHAVRGTGIGANASVSRNKCVDRRELIQNRPTGGFGNDLCIVRTADMPSLPDRSVDANHRYLHKMV